MTRALRLHFQRALHRALSEKSYRSRPSQFWVPAFLGGLIIAITAAYGPLWLPLAIMGATIGLQMGCTAYWLPRRFLIERLPSIITVPIRLSCDTELFEQYERFGETLLFADSFSDHTFRELMVERLAAVNSTLRELGEGKVSYPDTETWRIAYERLLRGPGMLSYKSVAWVRTGSYWTDEPGRKSMELNFELQERGGVRIERIVILAPELWHEDRLIPNEPVRSWLFEQTQNGIEIGLVRQSDLANEPDLLADMGIYGSRAVGIQSLNGIGRTVLFTLYFSFSEVLAAESRWNRLTVYSVRLGDLVQREKLANLN